MTDQQFEAFKKLHEDLLRETDQAGAALAAVRDAFAQAALAVDAWKQAAKAYHEAILEMFEGAGDEEAQ